MQRIAQAFARSISDRTTPCAAAHRFELREMWLDRHRDDGCDSNTFHLILGSTPVTNQLMFTGLIEEVGSVLDFPNSSNGQLRIQASSLSGKVSVGDSVAVNGCCLTVVKTEADEIVFDLLQETLNCTNLRRVQRGSPVNLEAALAVNGRVGGHFVQGHVDCTADLLATELTQADRRLEIELPSEFAHYVAYKGSIAVNGVSLTIAEHADKSFVTWVIPHTQAKTNLGSISPGNPVNLEFDLIAKYLERMLRRPPIRPE